MKLQTLNDKALRDLAFNKPELVHKIKRIYKTRMEARLGQENKTKEA